MSNPLTSKVDASALGDAVQPVPVSSTTATASTDNARHNNHITPETSEIKQTVPLGTQRLYVVLAQGCPLPSPGDLVKLARDATTVRQNMIPPMQLSLLCFFTISLSPSSYTVQWYAGLRQVRRLAGKLCFEGTLFCLGNDLCPVGRDGTCGAWRPSASLGSHSLCVHGSDGSLADYGVASPE
jgi:hypothetical protein